MSADLQIEEDATSGGTCECCGNATVSLSGFISDGSNALAAYIIAYTKGRPDHGAEFTIVTGNWGEGATAEQRYVIVLHHFPDRGFMIDSDIADKKANMRDLASNFLDREDIIGSDFAQTLFGMVDAIYINDSRLDEIRNWKTDA